MKTMIKIPLTFLILLIIGSLLIYFGSRNDAVSVAKNIKTGVVTADQINVSFQNVAGTLIKRAVQESQIVKKGEVLMVLDDRDLAISIAQKKAVIQAQKALISQENAAIAIDNNEANLAEISNWRNIEELQAKLDAAKATKELAIIDHDRMLKLSKTQSVAQSSLDNAKNTLTVANMSVIQLESQLATATIGASKEQLLQFLNTKKADNMTLLSVINLREKVKNRQNVLLQLQAQLAQFNAELQQLEVNYQRLTLLAPESGKILKLLYEEGEIIPTGAPAVLLETDRKYVDIYVNENMVSDYLPKTSVLAKVPAIDANIHGTVRFAVAAPSFSDLRTTRERGQADLVLYQVRIYVDDNSQLLTGMTLEVDNEQYH